MKSVETVYLSLVYFLAVVLVMTKSIDTMSLMSFSALISMILVPDKDIRCELRQ